MAPARKYYTVGVSNKFSAFAERDSSSGSEGESSDGEEIILSSAPPIDAKAHSDPASASPAATAGAAADSAKVNLSVVSATGVKGGATTAACGGGARRFKKDGISYEKRPTFSSRLPGGRAQQENNNTTAAGGGSFQGETQYRGGRSGYYGGRGRSNRLQHGGYSAAGGGAPPANKGEDEKGAQLDGVMSGADEAAVAGGVQQYRSSRGGGSIRRGGGERGYRGGGGAGAAGRGRGRDRVAAEVGSYNSRHTALPGGGRDAKKAGGGAHNWGDDEQVAEREGVKALEQERDEAKNEEAAEEGEITGKKESTEGEEEQQQQAPEEQRALDLEEYKRLLAEKRQSLPSFVEKKTKKITTEQELAAEGYVRHVKDREAEDSSDNEEEKEQQPPQQGHNKEATKQKAINVFEYIHRGGGRVSLFPPTRFSRGGRGGSSSGRGGAFNRRGGAARGGSGKDDNYRGNSGEAAGGSQRAGGFRGRDSGAFKSRDAPDIEDKRAFPSLNGN